MKKNLPIGRQSFEEIIRNNLLYVDKTRYIYELITTGSIYFLSRPRRFGKSLTISTLDALFSGKKDLFKDLWISKNTTYAFPVYPVIRIDLTQISVDTGELLIFGLKDQLQKIAKRYQISLEMDKPYPILFQDLILALKKINSVVVLIDEYDKPLIHHLGKDLEKAKINREILKEFYGILKGQDENLRFVLLTGVSKFSKVGVFSGLNQLDDLTFLPKYAGMLGITQAELENNFADYLAELSHKMNQPIEKVLDEIRAWYNGYQFSDDETVKVYNPFSTLKVLAHQQFSAHWFETGTPTFLLNLIQSQNYDFTVLEEYKAEEDMFSTYELEDLEILPLLVQTGYLSIKGKSGTRYILGYPNFEVKNGFLNHLFKKFTFKGDQLRPDIWKLVSALDKEDLATFFEISKHIFLEIPYDIQLKAEKYYQSLWYLIIKLTGIKAAAEYHTNRGRVDMVVETSNSIYVFELKIKGTPEEALEQIQKKGYAEEFKNSPKHVFWIGVSFDLDAKNIKEWKSLKF